MKKHDIEKKSPLPVVEFITAMMKAIIKKFPAL